jgi:hypothetical protein
MSGWRVLTGERRRTWCPLALALRDEFSSGGALARPAFTLERQAGSDWLPAAQAPAMTSGGIYVWPGVGRAADPLALPQSRVRVTITLDHQIPFYRVTDDALEFDVPAWNNDHDPALSPLMPQTVLLAPGPSYPFSRNLRVLRGRVLDSGGGPVRDALLVADGLERAITDASGAYSLALRWQASSGPAQIAVSHPRSGRSALVNATLPGDLAASFDITVT